MLGCASVARRLVIPAIKSSGVFELAAIASREMTKAAECCRQFGGEPLGSYDALLEREDIEAVYVPLPTGLHAEWAGKALQAGKHVLVEKSLAANLAAAERLLVQAATARRALWENFMFEHHSQFAYIRRQLSEGAVGEIRSLRASFGFPPFQDEGNIRYSRALGGGALLDAGAYTVKVAQLLLGADLEVRGASLVIPDGAEVDIHGGAFLCRPDGCSAALAFGFDHFYQCELEIWGSKGKLTADRIFTAPPGFQPTVVIERPNETRRVTLPADNHFIRILQVFHQAVVSGEFPSNYEILRNQASLLHNIQCHANC